MYGVWNVTHMGWCYITDEEREAPFHKSLVREAPRAVAEKELERFRKEYPEVEYELRMHSSDCYGTRFGQCCGGVSPEEQY